MGQLTWGEFKEIIDKGLKEQGGGDDTTIWYIDISFPCSDHDMCRPEVGIDDDLGMSV